MNFRRHLQASSALLIVISVALFGCTAPDEHVATTVTVDVTPDNAFTIHLPNVGTLSGKEGSVSQPGTITVSAVPGEDLDPGIALEAVGTGFRVEIEGTTLVADLDLAFEASSGAPDSVPVLIHQASNGEWDLQEASLDDDGRLLVATRAFSSWWPAWLDVPKALEPLFRSIANFFSGRTDPDPCAGGAPEWASLEKRTTLVHTCLITNTSDIGAVRAEVQLKSNRGFFTVATIPAEADYVWNEAGNAWLGNLLATWIPAASGTNEYLLFPQSRMTAGYLQPERDIDDRIVIHLDHWTAALSLTWSVLTKLTDLSDERGGWAALIGLAVCADKVPASGVDGWFGYFTCVMSDALESLSDPEKALRVALNTFGEVPRGDIQAAAETIGKADRLQTIGKVFKFLGVGSVVLGVFQQIPDAISQTLNERPGDVILRLGAPGPLTDVSRFATQSGVVCDLMPESEGYPEDTVACYSNDWRSKVLVVDPNTGPRLDRCPAAVGVAILPYSEIDFACLDRVPNARVLAPGTAIKYGGYECAVEGASIECALTSGESSFLGPFRFRFGNATLEFFVDGQWR